MCSLVETRVANQIDRGGCGSLAEAKDSCCLTPSIFPVN